MRLRLATTCSACVLAAAAAGGCGGGSDDASTARTAAPAAGAPATRAQLDPGAPALSALLAQVPDSARARGRIAAVDLERVRALRADSPNYARAVRAALTTQDRRLVAAAGPGAQRVARVGGTLLIAGDGVEQRTPEVVPVEDGRQVAGGRGRIVVGRSSPELLAGTPSTPLVSRRELALVQLCAGAAVTEVVLGPDAAGFNGDSAGGIALIAPAGRERRPRLVLCSVPGLGIPFAGIEEPLRRGLRAAGLRRVGPITETDDDATERLLLSAVVEPTPRALALFGDEGALARVLRGGS